MSAAERLRPGVVVGHDRRVRHEPEAVAPANRPDEPPPAQVEVALGQRHRPGRAAGDDRAAVVGLARVAAPTADPSSIDDR